MSAFDFIKKTGKLTATEQDFLAILDSAEVTALDDALERAVNQYMASSKLDGFTSASTLITALMDTLARSITTTALMTGYSLKEMQGLTDSVCSKSAIAMTELCREYVKRAKQELDEDAK